MIKKIRFRESVMLITPCLLVGGCGLVRHTVVKPVHQVTVQSIAFRSVTAKEAQEGYDTKVSVTVMPHGSPPQLAGKKYINSDISLYNVQLFSQTGPTTTQIVGAKPGLHILLSKHIVVSFLLKRRSLPKTKLILRAVFRHRYMYQATGKRTQYEFHDSVTVPIKVTIGKTGKVS